MRAVMSGWCDMISRMTRCTSIGETTDFRSNIRNILLIQIYQLVNTLTKYRAGYQVPVRVRVPVPGLVPGTIPVVEILDI